MPSDTAYDDRADGADTKQAEFEQPKRSLFGHVQHVLHNNPTIIPLIILALSVAYFAFETNGRLLSGLAIKVTLEQVSIVGILAVAQTIIILTAGIDLSVGAVMVLSYVVMGIVSVEMGWPAPVGILAGFLTGAFLGAISGLLVTKVRLPPFIVTLGLWQMVLASVFLVTGSQSIRSQQIDEAAPLLKLFGKRVEIGDWQLTLMGAPVIYGVLLMLLVFVVFWYILGQTAWGRHIYAVGDDKEAAELAGVQTDRVLMRVYIVGGLVAAIAAWAAIGRVGSISPTSFREANLDTIAAVVIGGTSLFGGRGGILGTLFGALTVGVFATGLRLNGADPQWVLFWSGALIILAVALDQWIRRISA